MGRIGALGCDGGGGSRLHQLGERPPLCPSCRPASLKWSPRATQDLQGLSHPRSGPCRKHPHGPRHEHSRPQRWQHTRTGNFILLLEMRGKQALSPHAGLDPVPGHRGEPGPGEGLPSRELTKPRPWQPRPGAAGPTNLPPGLNQHCVSEPLHRTRLTLCRGPPPGQWLIHSPASLHPLPQPSDGHGRNERMSVEQARPEL